MLNNQEKPVKTVKIEILTNKKPIKSFIDNILVPVIVGILIALLIRTLFTPVNIVGDSMYPTLKNGQLYTATTLFDKDDITYDIIVCFKPSTDVVKYIKRVVALPGDTVEIIDGYLYVNGIKQKTSFPKMESGGIIENNPITLDNDEYFCLGDNRNASNDSRFIGPVKYEQIKYLLKHKIF